MDIVAYLEYNFGQAQSIEINISGFKRAFNMQILIKDIKGSNSLVVLKEVEICL